MASRTAISMLACTIAIAAASCGGGGGAGNDPAPAPSTAAAAPARPTPFDPSPSEPAPSGPPPARPAPSPASASGTLLETEDEAARFLIRAGFGGDIDEIRALVGTAPADWIRSQLRVPATPYLQPVLAASGARDTRLDDNLVTNVFLRAGIEGEDVLRQRMVFAPPPPPCRGS